MTSPYAAVSVSEQVIFRAEPGPRRISPCRVYWGSHGCSMERGHEGDCDCGCCDCGERHPDAGDGVLCVARAPYYGPGTRFYGEDVQARGLPEVDG